jgi:hypothetical protein
MRNIVRFGAVILVAATAAHLQGPAFAAGAHDHGSQTITTLQVKLNNGQRWQTDEALRLGMNKMRGAIATALPKIHNGKLSASEFGALAGKVQEQIDYITANCKLPEDADLVLHGILEQVIEGASTMKGQSNRAAGAVKIVEALNVYGKSFDHPAWKALTH